MKEKIKTVLFWLILLQPIFALDYFYNDELDYNFSFVLPTVIRFLLLLTLIYLFFKQKDMRTRFIKNKYLLIYIVLLLLYAGLHLFYTQMTFHSYMGHYPFNHEVIYLVRMLAPLIVIYITYHSDFGLADFKLLIAGIAGFISCSIVITNLLRISLKSYGSGRISFSILEWFAKTTASYTELASKGFFTYGNLVSALLLMTLPLMIFNLITDFNWLNCGLYIAQALAMLELGTKVASLGFIIGNLVAIGIFLFHKYVIKDLHTGKKALICAIVAELGAVCIFPISPTLRRTNSETYLVQKSASAETAANKRLDQGLKKHPQGQKRQQFIIQFITHNYHTYGLNPELLYHAYPLENDPEFWLRIICEPGQKRMQNRYLEKAILLQTIHHDHNQLDLWLGISHIKEMSICNLENDFVSQIFSLGIIGMPLFVGIYLVTMIYIVILWLRNRHLRTYLNSSLITAATFLLAAAITSGNVLDNPTAGIILAFIMGFLLFQLKKANAE